VHEWDPQTGSSVLLGLDEDVGIHRGSFTPIVGVNSVVQFGEGSRKLQDFGIEIPDGLDDLRARPRVGLRHEYVEGLEVGDVLVLKRWDPMNRGHGVVDVR